MTAAAHRFVSTPRSGSAVLPAAGSARRADNPPKGALPAALLPQSARMERIVVRGGIALMLGLFVLDQAGAFGW